jgi:Ca-activated chloride channel family protein
VKQVFVTKSPAEAHLLQGLLPAAVMFRVVAALLLSLAWAGTTSLLLSQTPANRAIRVDVDQVLVNVTVTNNRDQYVQGLEQSHFKIFEDNIEQEIVHFATEDAAVTLGIIIDRSGSMGESRQLQVRGPINRSQQSSLTWASESAYSCLQDSLQRDEFFMIEFSDEPQLVVDFTHDMTRLKQRLVFLKPGGNTALWDAVEMGVAKMKDAANPRKALLVLSDGEENHSRLSLTALKNLIREEDVRIYFFGFQAGGLADLTGGRVFTGAEPCKQLQADLKNQYLLGYSSTNRAKDGRWRDIRVRLQADRLPQVLKDSRVRAKTGYYADEE